MLSNKEIIVPNNLLNAALKNKGVKAGIVNAGKPLPMLSVQDAVKENLIDPIFIGDEKEILKCAEDLKWDISKYEIINEPVENNTAGIAAKLASEGKIRVAARNNQSIPVGVALDKFGKPTTDAKKALAGVQLPIAGFRGSGLAWMVDILSGVLTGGNHAGRVKDPFDDFSGPQNIGHLFITFKANLFQKNYNQRIKDNIKTIKKLPKIKGVKEIMYPGQNKYARYKNNSKKEISIPDIIKKDLENLIS